MKVAVVVAGPPAAGPSEVVAAVLHCVLWKSFHFMPLSVPASLAALYGFYLRTPIALATLAAIGSLLYLEHRLSDDVELAFFKINAVLGFGILGFVAAGMGRFL